MNDIDKYLAIKDRKKRMGKFLNDEMVKEIVRQGHGISQNEWSKILSERANYPINSVSLGAWMNGERLPEGDNKRGLVNALGLVVYDVLEEEYFEATDELVQELEREVDFMTHDDMAEVRAIIERIRKRRGAYGNAVELSNAA